MPHIHLWWQNQNIKAFIRWPAIVLTALTALWDQMFLEHGYIIWCPSTLLKGFIISDNSTFASPSVNMILHCLEAGSHCKGKQKVQEGRKLKTAVPQKCECQELFLLPQHLFLFCQPTDTGLSHSFYSVITLLCQEYPEGGYWKWQHWKGGFSITECYYRAFSVQRNLYVREQQKGKGSGEGLKCDSCLFL